MKVAKRIWTYIFIVLLALVSALNYQLFIFPNRFAPSGLNGICTMIQHVFGISVGYLNLVINIPLALLVLWKVGRSMGGRSMLYVVSFSLALLLLEHVDLTAFQYATENGTSKILGPLVAGVINGGVYIVLIRCSSTSGGMDFVSALIHHYHPEKNFFTLNFSINICIAIASYFVYDHEMEPVLLCILYSYMTSSVSDRAIKSGRSAIHCEIITDHPKEISYAIIHELHHSATMVPATGMYRGHKTNILFCTVNKT